MKLQQIFSSLEELAPGFPPLEINQITQDSRNVSTGNIYIAIRGEKRDGHDYLEEAISRGALVLVVENKSKVPNHFKGTVVEVKDTRKTLDYLASAFYYKPGRELFCVGITGTNGKTSIAYLVEAILNHGNKMTGVIGTINHHCGAQVWPTELTTPDSLFLQKRLREFCDLGAKAVAIEVSSHALMQKRVESVPFDCVVFSNLSRDHLDYHKTMKNYFLAKQRLFADLLWSTSKNPSRAIVNSDDIYGRRLRIAETAGLWTYGRKDCDFQFRNEEFDFGKTKFLAVTPVGEILVEIKTSGLHNIYNSLAAIAVGVAAGMTLPAIAEALKNFSGVPGRMQFVETSRNFSAVVDYAHTPDALQNTLHSLNEIRRRKKEKGGKIWCVFGCGGDRDVGKRPLMAKIAADSADHIIVTSDNPRREDPLKIIQEINNGFDALSREKVKLEPDRQKAIEMALTLADSQDVVLIAGKGHEDYQIIGDQKIHLSDVEIIQKFFKG
ncbi:MAG: UDP-N-acetylmuramoyl-L-alanyl-D-glutamate--2,6-diaminopimelate ligase [Bdellovibrionota bacterium]